ncbi:oxidoreductase, short-chain dehydrogenase/reductase family protein [Oceaniovalibus guishaninsula JLT2003]|uniref:Oxidoreductase, short-chain dehydrogenase/reductase family protein n=1 Tax=Oceaniovalibus guishaninsula JLT2003 TaxID=1231392 RepID=K2I7V6_9RHOB|nr:SDR family oxidoreductase [Oceaniovalibus guishaninsula]EKE45095.1 oxidoreductase, short-chain dehydrogenase/reductase family protein [Oceaniovalibus guishaninsula JLT2003]
MSQIALVTGASRGLGAALALALAPTHHIVAVARTTGGLEDLDDRIRDVNGAATLAPLDVTDRDAMAHMCRDIHERWGHVDLWLHTAIHAGPLAPAGHLDIKDWNKSVAVNATATAMLIPMVEPLLRAAKTGRAVFFDDPRAGQKFFGHYGASKAAQMALVRSWAAETANTGPRVDVLSPRPMPTATRARFFPGEDRTALADPLAEARRLLAIPD